MKVAVGKPLRLDDVCTHRPVVFRPLDKDFHFVHGACSYCDNLMIEGEDVDRFLSIAKSPAWRTRLEERLIAGWTTDGTCLSIRLPLMVFRDELCLYTEEGTFTKAMMEWLQSSILSWEAKNVAFVEVQGSRIFAEISSEHGLN